MKIFYLPLELIDMRYTKSQDDITTLALQELSIDYKLINGDVLSNKKKSNEFLNPTSTNFFKFKQLQQITGIFIKGIKAI